MRVLNTILTEINTTINANLDISNIQFWGEAHLQTKDSETFPLVNIGSNGYKISINDAYAMQSYFRVIETKMDSDYSKGKGKYPWSWRVRTIRNIWFGNYKKLGYKTYEQSDDFINQVYDAYPVFLSGSELLNMTSDSTDKITIFNTEFDGVSLQKITLEIMAFFIEFELRQRVRFPVEC